MANYAENQASQKTKVNPMDLTFNIIFVPGMVHYLRLAIQSLLKFSPYQFRLVSNGVRGEEWLRLKQFCDQHDRLTFYDASTPNMIPHGTLLTRLWQQERGEHFCFMDPDIFATLPFHEPLEEHLSECDVFSSCQTLSVDPDETWIGFQGRCTRAPTGQALATTFFAVYRNEPLRQVIAAGGVGFERYVNLESIPDPVRQYLVKQGIDARRYDTAKVLNLFMHSHGLRFKYKSLEGLHHIGGMASHFANSSEKKTITAIARRWLRSRFSLCDRDFEILPDPHSDPDAPTTNRPWLTVEEFRRCKRASKCRQQLAIFFSAYLKSLFDGAPEPRLEISDQLLRERICRTCDAIRSLYIEHDRLQKAA